MAGNVTKYNIWLIQSQDVTAVMQPDLQIFFFLIVFEVVLYFKNPTPVHVFFYCFCGVLL